MRRSTTRGSERAADEGAGAGVRRAAGTLARSLARSLVRIVVAVMLGVAVLVAALGLALRRPTLSSAPTVAAVPAASPERLERDVRWLTTEVLPRTSEHPENLRRAADYLQRGFTAAGLDVRRDEYEVHGERFAIVRARLGSGAWKPARLVVGAHYDAFDPGFGITNPGADDNASGVAGLVELARLLSSAPSSVPGGLELVAFPNEEPPHFAQATMGSAVYVRNLMQERARVAPPPAFLGMIALEMIGYTSRRQPWPNWLLRTLYPNHGHFSAVVGRHADRELVQAVKRGLRTTGSAPQALVLPRSVVGFDASDHRSFWQAGLPAVVVSDTAFVRNPHYHSETDTHARLDYEFLAGVVEGVAVSVLSLE